MEVKQNIILNSEKKGIGLIRHKFLKTGLTVATAFTIIPSYVLSNSKEKAPSNKLNMVAIGIGAMGWNDLNNDAFKNENIVALCDINQLNLKRASERFPKAKPYNDWRKALEQKDINAVYIASNNQSRAFILLWAMNRGLHVYCIH